MSQESQHGKWTLSSSDDEEDPVSTQSRASSAKNPSPPLGQPPDSGGSQTKVDVSSVDSQNLQRDPVKPSGQLETPDHSTRVGSEARQAASSKQRAPLKLEPPWSSGKRSPATKRKKQTEDSGWNLSSSDEGSDSEQRDQKDTKTQSPGAKRMKREPDRESPETASYKQESDESLGAWDELPQGDETFRFYLAKVTGVERKYNTGALHMKDILSPLFGTLKESVQFNYCFNVKWMVQQYPPEFRNKPLLIVHGEKRESKARLFQEAQPYEHVSLCQAKLDIAFGTHHTKMMLLLYEEGLRVVIHTSNMIPADWFQKTQGIWMSPLYVKMPEGSSEKAGESTTNFKHDLMEYLGAYHSPTLNEWVERIKGYDLSETRVHLIGSTPGRFLGGDLDKWGHMKLRKLLSENMQPTPKHESWPVIGQFSSIGSLGIDKTKWLAAEFQRTLTAPDSRAKTLQSPEVPMHLVYPTVDNVRTSLEGYPAGASLPYSIQTAQKQLWLHSYFHKWSAEGTGRSHAMPHIKTYMRASPDFTELAWFLVTSANLSKAAWGAMEKNNTQLMIRSYELGVLFLPSAFNMATFPVQENPFSGSKSPTSSFTVPFDLPPARYTVKDQPWIWNIPYTQGPDTHGNVWVPS
ncbi:tyrosyl-DNA phosphodiesterase 1 [Amia ocellicauda]|uniref:tyrosyl-DNA phosphodiesterase 1 n=1 Tax=Amia ocellicauda TaxID=2972642 RepID=UPI00346464D6